MNLIVAKRTPQQNGVAERKNRTLIKAARTMLADSKLPTTFWVEAVNTACYVQNRVLVIKPHNKTPYELFLGRKPALSFMRPFGCPVTILNTIDQLGKFDGNVDEGFFVGYSTNSKAFRGIFRYLKGQSKLGLWYPKDSPFNLEAYTDSDYAGASLDRKSTTRGYQFLERRLISWQCKKQTIVANFTTEVEYVAASSCCGQVLWIQNQLLDYGYNFMNTKIFIDNESTICIVKNLVFHSKTKHIEIRHHFIKDSYEKRLIQVIKIHTDHNVADLLTKAFDMRLSLRSGKTEWKGLPLLLLAYKQSRTMVPRYHIVKAQIRFEAASKQSIDLPLFRVNTLGSREDNMKLKELMEFCTKLSEMALDL
ncbi:putative ribonuclease H-like domain-containing protein [Tanacetum coccineum]